MILTAHKCSSSEESLPRESCQEALRKGAGLSPELFTTRIQGLGIGREAEYEVRKGKQEELVHCHTPHLSAS